jgi:hypothetical protein
MFTKDDYARLKQLHNGDPSWSAFFRGVEQAIVFNDLDGALETLGHAFNGMLANGDKPGVDYVMSAVEEVLRSKRDPLRLDILSNWRKYLGSSGALSDWRRGQPPPWWPSDQAWPPRKPWMTDPDEVRRQEERERKRRIDAAESERQRLEAENAALKRKRDRLEG